MKVTNKAILVAMDNEEVVESEIKMLCDEIAAKKQRLVYLENLQACVDTVSYCFEGEAIWEDKIADAHYRIQPASMEHHRTAEIFDASMGPGFGLVIYGRSVTIGGLPFGISHTEDEARHYALKWVVRGEKPC